MSWKSRGVVFLVNLDDMEGGLTPWSFVCLFSGEWGDLGVNPYDCSQSLLQLLLFLY